MSKYESIEIDRFISRSSLKKQLLRPATKQNGLSTIGICGFDVPIAKCTTPYSKFKNRKITSLIYYTPPIQYTRRIRQSFGHFVRSDKKILRIPFSSTTTFFNTVREVAVSFCRNAQQPLEPSFGLVLGPTGRVIDLFVTLEAMQTVNMKPFLLHCHNILLSFSRILNHTGSLSITQPMFKQETILYSLENLFQCWMVDVSDSCPCLPIIFSTSRSISIA